MKKEQLGFNLVLLGMVASGKDTQADILKEKYALYSIESGKYWRKMEKANTPDGAWLRRTHGKGKPAPVALMKKFLLEHTAKKPKNKDMLFLGNPRLKPEAQLLKKIMADRKEDFYALYITLPDKEAYNRSLPRNRNVDDMKYVHKRIAWHKDQVGKTVKYFQELGKMKKIKGDQSIEAVAKDIAKAIAGFQRVYRSS